MSSGQVLLATCLGGRSWRCLASGLVLVALASCKPSVDDEIASAKRIEAALLAYAPMVTAAYESGNVELLRGHAAEKEMAHVAKLISDRAAEGQVLVPTLVRLSLESHSVWNAVNAFATTVEVWDLRLYTTGEQRQLIRESLAQPSRVKYQMKEVDGRWTVLLRETDRVLQ